MRRSADIICRQARGGWGGGGGEIGDREGEEEEGNGEGEGKGRRGICFSKMSVMFA